MIDMDKLKPVDMFRFKPKWYQKLWIDTLCLFLKIKKRLLMKF